MKTIDLEEVKKQVLKKYGYNKPWVALSLDDKALISDEVSAEYAKQCCEEQTQQCAKKAKTEWEAVLNTPNVAENP